MSTLCACGCGSPTKVVFGRPNKYLRYHCHVGRKPEPIETKYNLDIATGCFLWAAGMSDTGYGTYYDPAIRRYLSAHVFMYEQRYGPVPEGLELDHLCEVRRCVNPDHLEAVTKTINLRRGKGTKLTIEQAYEIHKLNKEGVGYRKLARMFSVHRSTICHLITGRNWKEVA